MKKSKAKSKVKALLSSVLVTKKSKIVAGILATVIVAGGILATTGMVSAAFKGVIPFFAEVTGTANVSQSIKLDDHIYGTNAAWTYTANNIAGGETVFNGPHFIRNTASVPIKVTLTTAPDSSGVVNRDRKSTRLNSSHTDISRMPSSA